MGTTSDSYYQVVGFSLSSSGLLSIKGKCEAVLYANID